MTSRKGLKGCYQSQNYKIWKQFTTFFEKPRTLWVMLSIIKLQNLKAIHNPKFLLAAEPSDVINHKTTKFESNSQQDFPRMNIVFGCYQSQNYKIWKQFTTKAGTPFWRTQLLSITKLQNLKAIHNYDWLQQHFIQDVINHKTTKFESNSQHAWNDKKAGIRCYQSQNYKIWKQFTTDFSLTG